MLQASVSLPRPVPVAGDMPGARPWGRGHASSHETRGQGIQYESERAVPPVASWLLPFVWFTHRPQRGIVKQGCA